MKLPPFKLLFFLVFLPGAFFWWNASKDGSGAERFTTVVRASGESYTVALGGSLDGFNTKSPVGYYPYKKSFEPNISFEIENTGEVPIRNPRVRIKGGEDYFSKESIARSVLKSAEGDREKAMTAFEFMRTRFFHAAPLDFDNASLVRLCHSYGFFLCSEGMVATSLLWSSAGLKSRAVLPHNHDVAEVYYDGDFHLFDTDHDLFYLKRDNRTVASLEALQKDPDLIRRAHHLGVSGKTDPDFAELMIGNLSKSHGQRDLGEMAQKMDDRMAGLLKPGEKLRVEWSHEGLFRGEDPEHWPGTSKTLYNGKLIYRPDIRKGELAKGAAFSQNMDLGDDGTGKVYAHPSYAGQEAFFILEFRSPYVIVGLRLKDKVLRKNAGDRLDVSVSFDGKNWTRVKEGPPVGKKKRTLNLGPLIKKRKQAVYFFYLRYDFAAAQSQEDVGLLDLKVEAVFQATALTLPNLRLGPNELLYRDDNEGPREVRLTHVWKESDANTPPDPPETPLYPLPGGKAGYASFVFRWKETKDPDTDAIEDYHFQLSEDPGMRWPLSSNFDRLTATLDAGLTAFEVPGEGFLNPGTRYYWRVRAMDRKGAWSEWSPVWSFTAGGVALPKELRYEKVPGGLRLRWKKVSSAQHYEVYGSNERGFKASKRPYRKVVRIRRKEGTWHYDKETADPNFLGESQTTDFTVQKNPKVFYRVVAVEAGGNRSGPSGLLEVDHPLIYSEPPSRAITGEYFTYRISSVRSDESLAAADNIRDTGEFSFYNREKIRYYLVEGPEWISLEESSGLLRGTPPPGSEGRHSIIVAAESQFGKDTQAFELTVE